MHLVCCIKQVPDTADVKIDPETNTLMRAGVESISNPYDIVAVEQAVQLKERYGGRVTVLTMGPPQAQLSLREALSIGADEAILLSDRSFAGADTLATSFTLSKAIARLHAELPVDLVLCGKQAIDGDTAQTGPGIATRLGFTQFTYVIDVEWTKPDERAIQVRRKIEGGIEVIRGPLPALLSVELELLPVRRAALPALIDSLRAPITIWDAQAIGAPPDRVGIKGSPTWVRAISSPPAKAGGPLIDAHEDIPKAVGEALDIVFSDKAFLEKFQHRWES
jgi:electron transfer flavoprotein beta subunit